LPAGDPRASDNDPRYADVLRAGAMPRTECLKDTVARVVPFWNEAIAPAITRGKRVVVPRTATRCAHWSSISTASPTTTSCS
jgi:2,3-bisphosphoglycerate-dependent phosphoglycerate mutase